MLFRSDIACFLWYGSSLKQKAREVFLSLLQCVLRKQSRKHEMSEVAYETQQPADDGDDIEEVFDADDAKADMTRGAIDRHDVLLCVVVSMTVTLAIAVLERALDVNWHAAAVDDGGEPNEGNYYAVEWLLIGLALSVGLLVLDTVRTRQQQQTRAEASKKAA